MKQQYACHQQMHQKRQRLRRQRIIGSVILALLLLLIWGNSLQPAEASSAFSTGVLSKLQPLWFQLTNSSFLYPIIYCASWDIFLNFSCWV